MRQLGVGLAGLVAGLLIGLVLHELVARAAMDDGVLPDSFGLALLLGLLTPTLAVVGAALALVWDGRRSRRQRERGVKK